MRFTRSAPRVAAPAPVFDPSPLGQSRPAAPAPAPDRSTVFARVQADIAGVALRAARREGLHVACCICDAPLDARAPERAAIVTGAPFTMACVGRCLDEARERAEGL